MGINIWEQIDLRNSAFNENSLSGRVDQLGMIATCIVEVAGPNPAPSTILSIVFVLVITGSKRG